jgi:hypothetical protein
MTHGDNAFGHAQWKARFPAAVRVLHSFDLMPHTRRVELLLRGDGPWDLDAFAAAAAAARSSSSNSSSSSSSSSTSSSSSGSNRSSSVQILYTPGHTFGSISVLYTAPAAAVATGAATTGSSDSSSSSDCGTASSSDSIGVLFCGDTLGYSRKYDRLDGWSKENRAGRDRQAKAIRALAQVMCSPDLFELSCIAVLSVWEHMGLQ